MSTNEFVVIQAWTPYNAGVSGEGRWLDYSRCTARQAVAFLDGRGETWRAVHWIRSEVVLSEWQQLTMAEMVPSQWENRPPGTGDHWAVTVEWDTTDTTGDPCTRIQERIVDGWTGPGWQDMVNDLSREAAETGDTVKSVKLH